MAQYVSRDPNVLVRAQNIHASIYALEAGREFRTGIIRKHGIDLDAAGESDWINMQTWLNAFKDIADEVGEKTIFQIGKAIPEHAQFPPEVNNLEVALHTIDHVYRYNHSEGDIGSYRVTEFDPQAKRAVMVVDSPYPSEFDRGIITTILRRFKPADSLRHDVVLDVSQPTRKNGADSCTYRIIW